MNNFEKIKQMTVDEMAEWLDCISEECSDMCVASYDLNICNIQFCEKNIKQWLFQEVEE